MCVLQDEEENTCAMESTLICHSTRNPGRYYNKIAWGKFGTYWVFYIALAAFLFSDLARDLEVSVSLSLSLSRARFLLYVTLGYVSVQLRYVSLCLSIMCCVLRMCCECVANVILRSVSVQCVFVTVECVLYRMCSLYNVLL